MRTLVRTTLKQKLLTLYEVGLQSNILYIEDKIAPTDLQNIIRLIINSQETGKWTRNHKIQNITKILQDHRHRILGNESEAYYLYNLANLQFYEGKFYETIDTIAQVQFTDINYILVVRRLKIKAYHDLDTIDDLDREINSFRTAMYRGSIEGVAIPKKRKESNMHFIKVLKRIVHPKTYKNNTRINKLIKEIQETRLVAERKWLLEKLEEQK